jgi:hypothetical protein
MTTEDEIKKGLLELFAEIAKREKKKAIGEDDYLKASLASVLESLFKDARKSIE